MSVTGVNGICYDSSIGEMYVTGFDDGDAEVASQLPNPEPVGRVGSERGIGPRSGCRRVMVHSPSRFPGRTNRQRPRPRARRLAGLAERHGQRPTWMPTAT